MTKSKLKTPFDKANSTFQKEVNKLNKDVAHFQALSLRRKKEIGKYSNFIHTLIKDGRVTKEELKELFTKL
jgi:hypothetical protein